MEYLWKFIKPYVKAFLFTLIALGVYSFNCWLFGTSFNQTDFNTLLIVAVLWNQFDDYEHLKDRFPTSFKKWMQNQD